MTPAGGRDLEDDIAAAVHKWFYEPSGAPCSNKYIAAELTRLGWTCAGSGGGAGQAVPDLSATLAACGWPAGVPFKLWDDGDPHGSVYLIHPDKGMTGFGACEGDMDERRVRFIVAACNAHMERLAAPVALACGISEASKDVIRYALNVIQAADETPPPMRRAAMVARAELDGLPVLGVGR